jgi:putative MATE family efflux protein
MTFGMLAVITFNIIDTIFVGQLGTVELAAMSFTFPVVMIISSITLGLGAGSSAVISHTIGTGATDKVRRLSSDSLLLSLLIGFLMTGAGLATMDLIFAWMGASKAELPHIQAYMTVWYLGLSFHILPMAGNSALRASGDMKTPSLIMGLSVALNLVFDPILIFGWQGIPAMGIQGAALASIIARSLATVLTLVILGHSKRLLTWPSPTLGRLWQSWRQILHIGLPTALSNIINPVASAVITHFFSWYGAAAVAAFGVATRIEAFALAVFMSLSAVLGPFIGQNLGANRLSRVKTGINLSQRFALIYGLAAFALLFLTRKHLVALFNDNPEVIAIAGAYLALVPLAYGVQGVLFSATTALNVFKKPLHAALLRLVYTFVLYIPLAYLGSLLWQIQGIFVAAITAKLISGALGWWLLRRVIRAKQQEIDSLYLIPTEPPANT